MQRRNTIQLIKNGILNVTVLFLLLFTLSCANRSSDSPTAGGGHKPPNPIGKQEYLEMATWNIEWFPKSGSKTINNVKNIIRHAAIDLYAVQEIASISAFNTLLDSLPGWSGVLSSDTYSSGSYQKTGIIYNSNLISISSVKNIFEHDNYPFPRPPLYAYVEIRDMTGVKYDFNLIVLHLKAFGDSQSENRRREAIIKLEKFVSDEIKNGADKDFVIMGDWNDRVSDTGNSNVFKPFLDKSTEYDFISKNLTTAIDHIMIAKDSFAEYGEGESNKMDLISDYPDYFQNVSDHLPILAQFKGFKLTF